MKPNQNAIAPAPPRTGSWLRFLPAIVLAAGLHGVLLFPQAFGIAVAAWSTPSDSSEQLPSVSADARTLARARESFARAAAAAVAEAEPSAYEPPEAEPSSPTQQAAPVHDVARPTSEAIPDHTEHKRLEGDPSEHAPEAPPDAEVAVAELAQPEPTPPTAEPQLAESSPTQRQHDELRTNLQRIEAQGGHLAAAFRRFEAQADLRRRGGAEGSEKGLPQLYVFEVPAGEAFYSYLDLFGSEVLAHAGADRFVHFVRTGARFEARALTRRALEQLSLARGLNLGYMIPLDDVMERMPQPLQEAVRIARSDAAFASSAWRLFALGTTREQAAVAASAQEHLRHHREHAPTARLWSELDRVEFRYLIDEQNRVYGVHVDAVAGPQ